MEKKEKDLIINLKNDGLGYKAIAIKLNKPLSTIKSFIKRNKELFNTPAQVDRCLCCGAVLIHTPKHKKKKFCNDSCRMKWWNGHPDVTGKNELLITCKCCGKVINSYRYPSRKFCSHNCYIRYRFYNGELHD